MSIVQRKWLDIAGSFAEFSKGVCQSHSPEEWGRHLAATLSFLADIGLQVRVGEVKTGFLSSQTAILHGTLVYAKTATAEYAPNLIGELLHEAGHMAVLPPNFRNRIEVDVDDLAVLVEGVLDAYPVENAMVRAATDALCAGSEAAASAWSHAAAHRLGIPEEVLALSYDDLSGARAEFDEIQTKRHEGISALASLGLATPPTFPVMQRWVVTEELQMPDGYYASKVLVTP